MVYVVWPKWPPCPYMVKKSRMTLMLYGMQHLLLEHYQVCSNDDPGLTLIYFTARSNLVLYAFVWEKVKTMDFSETIIVYDFKVGRWNQLNKYMKSLMSIKLVKPFKIFFYRTKRLMILKLGIQHLILRYYQIYPNDDSGLTYYTTRSNLIPFAYVWL